MGSEFVVVVVVVVVVVEFVDWEARLGCWSVRSGGLVEATDPSGGRITAAWNCDEFS